MLCVSLADKLSLSIACVLSCSESFLKEFGDSHSVASEEIFLKYFEVFLRTC